MIRNRYDARRGEKTAVDTQIRPGSGGGGGGRTSPLSGCRWSSDAIRPVTTTLNVHGTDGAHGTDGRTTRGRVKVALAYASRALLLHSRGCFRNIRARTLGQRRRYIMPVYFTIRGTRGTRARTRSIHRARRNSALYIHRATDTTCGGRHDKVCCSTVVVGGDGFTARVCVCMCAFLSFFFS